MPACIYKMKVKATEGLLGTEETTEEYNRYIHATGTLLGLAHSHNYPVSHLCGHTAVHKPMQIELKSCSSNIRMGRNVLSVILIMVMVPVGLVSVLRYRKMLIFWDFYTRYF